MIRPSQRRQCPNPRPLWSLIGTSSDFELLNQGYLVDRLKSPFRKLYGRYGDLIQQYEVSLSRMLNDILTLDQQ